MVNCYCGFPIAMRTSWTSENPGRKFKGCKFYNHETGHRGCNRFEWVDEDPTEWQRDVINVLIAEKKRLATDNHILNMRLVCVEDEKKRLEEDEMKKKKLKRTDFSPNVTKERNEIGMKLLGLCVLVSSVISVMVVKIFN